MNREEISFDAFHTYPSKVRKEILNDRSLLQVMLKKNVNAHRFAHSLSVAEVSESLARAHHFDPDRAYLAGLLHDCTKDFPYAFQETYLRYYDPEKLVYPEPVLHSFTAKYYLKEKLRLHDSDILNAVYNHTVCNSRDRLSLILYIADKREPLRGISDGILELAHRDLYKAAGAVSASSERYIRENKHERFIENRI